MSYRRVQDWAARLHGGQLAMLLVLGAPVAAIVGLASVAVLSDAIGRAARIEAGEFRENQSRFVMIGDHTFRIADSASVRTRSRIRAFADSQRTGAKSELGLRIDIAWAELPLTREHFVPSRTDLQAIAVQRYWALPLSLLAPAFILFCVWALWTWFGSRPKGHTRDTAINE